MISVNSYTVNDTAPSPGVVYFTGSRTTLFGGGRAVAPTAAAKTEETISKKKAKKARSSANGALATLPKKPGAKVRDHDAHVLVCGGGDCKKRGSKDVRRALKEELRERGMVGDVRVDSVGCLGLCKHGPNAVVYPGGVWYLGLREEDVPEVVERHLESGEPVEELAAGFRPRKRKK
ncbi:MAG: (2Fe-2S) ferredoxin domain-containing protein [Actinobacteria bacterium]|nr:(2Fe-2S) ferredoxin domain-containing protein [Actinomycetota bacterium]